MNVMPLPMTEALEFTRRVHRRLPRVLGGMWAIGLYDYGAMVGCAVVGRGSQAWEGTGRLVVTRCTVSGGVKNGCSMLYGACSRAAREMGARSLCTYTHQDESGVSLRAAGWVRDKSLTRPGQKSIDGLAKVRWWAPWSDMRIS